MPITSAGTLDRPGAAAAPFQLVDLVGSDLVADAWDRESALSGMTVGALTRHLVSQPERAVEFFTHPVQRRLGLLSLVGHNDLADGLAAPVGARGEHLIRDEFNKFGSAGHADYFANTCPFARAAGLGDRCGRADEVRAIAALRAAHRRLPRRAGDGDGGASRRSRVRRRRSTR